MMPLVELGMLHLQNCLLLVTNNEFGQRLNLTFDQIRQATVVHCYRLAFHRTFENPTPFSAYIFIRFYSRY